MQEVLKVEGNKHVIVSFPGNFRIKKDDIVGMLERKGKSEHFAIKNRSFDEINYYFNNRLLEEINGRCERITDGPVRILDVGAGIRSQAVADIGTKFKDKNVFAVSLDIAHQIELDTEVSRVFADVSMLPIESNSFDIVYSRQLFPFLMRSHKQHGERVRQGLTEIARVMTPGGIAFIDDEEEISGSNSKAEKMRESLHREVGIVLTNEGSNRVITRRTFPRIWEKTQHRSQFLVLKKPAVIL